MSNRKSYDDCKGVVGQLLIILYWVNYKTHKLTIYIIHIQFKTLQISSCLILFSNKYYGLLLSVHYWTQIPGIYVCNVDTKNNVAN